MRKYFLPAGCLLVLALLSPLQADPAASQSDAYIKSLYAKARNDVISNLTDDDFVSYCVTMNVGGDTLLKFHDEILSQQTQLDLLTKAGSTADDPKVMAIQATLVDLRAQYKVKIAEARKGLEIEAKIADETLVSLGQSR